MDTGLARRKQHLNLESLESRLVLTVGSLGMITGNIAFDANGNDIVDVGEAISGGTLELYVDVNGDEQLDDGDQLESSGLTGVDGNYIFTGLGPGNYLVFQPAQNVSGTALMERVSDLIVLDQGFEEGLLIDDFTGSGSVQTSLPAVSSADDVFAAAGAIGSQRDLSVAISNSTDDLDFASATVDAGRLTTTGDATTSISVTWDGVDAAGNGTSFTGLGGVDLSGAAIRLEGLGAPTSMAEIQMRVYTNETEFSQFTISDFGNVLLADLCVPFIGTNSDGIGFVGMGADGGADFANVGAIELEIISTEADANLSLDEIRIANSETESVQFLNEALPAAIGLEITVNGETCDPDCSDTAVRTGTNFPVTYTITNLGGQPLTEISLADELEGVIGAENLVSQSINDDEILDIAETWVFENTLSADEGLYVSQITVSGLDGDAMTIMALGEVRYQGINPVVTLDMLVNGFQAASIDAEDIPDILIGDTVTYTANVSNDGNVPLEVNFISVTDGVAPSDPVVISKSINDDDIIDVGEVWTYESTSIAQSGLHFATSTISTTPTEFPQFDVDSATDTVFYNGVPSAEIVLTVLTNGLNINDPAAAELVDEGSVVTFTYGVFNSGNSELSDITVEDDNGTPDDTADDFFADFLSGDDDSDGLLDPGEAWVFEATRTAILGAFSNLATATALDPTTNPVIMTDRGYYIGEAVELSWHNSETPTDVNADEVVSPVDANVVITELTLREFSDPETSMLDELTQQPVSFFDVNNDGFVSPLDALLVINDLPSTSALSASTGDLDVDHRKTAHFNAAGDLSGIAREANHEIIDRVLAVLDLDSDDGR